MIQNELQRVVAELDELISRDEERQDYCSETGPNEAMRRVVALTEIRNIVARLVAAARRIEAAQAVAPGGGEIDIRSSDGIEKAMARIARLDGIGACDALYELAVKHGASEAQAAGFAHTVNGAFSLLEGHVFDAMRKSGIAAAPASEPLRGSSTQFDLTDPKPASEAKGHDEHCDFMAFSTGNPECTCKPAASSAVDDAELPGMWSHSDFTGGATDAAEQEQAGECHCPQHGSWIAADDVKRMVRQIDVALNGEEGAAKQASLCDVTSQIVRDAALLRRAARVDVRPQYEQLIYAVGSKSPGETRHQTALRYINEREAAGNDAAESAALEPKE